LYIGPAGETLNRTAAVMQKWSHAAGYGGYGAVMGSKNLKAVVAKGTGPLPDVYDEEGMKSCLKKIIEDTIKSETPRLWGTAAGGYRVGHKRSAEPVRNWQEEWHDERRFGGPKFDFRYWVKRYWSDFNCAGSCMKLAVIKTGPYKGTFTDNPDYEMEAYLGPNLGVFDPGECIYLSALMDYLGFSGINGGNTLAFAAELYQREILTREDLGFELKWGDVESFEKLARKIVKREGIGDILAEGVKRAAEKIGKGAEKLANHIKGLEMTGYDIRGLKTAAIGYAVSFRGADHNRHGAYGLDLKGTVDRFKAEKGRGKLVIDLENLYTIIDSLIVCKFSRGTYYEGFKDLAKYYTLVTGIEMTPEELERTGESTCLSF